MQTAMAFDKIPVPGPDGDALERLLQLIYGRFAGQTICLAARLRIADQLASGRTQTGQLAEVLGAKPDSLRRFLRALASQGLLFEAAEDHWHLTALGALLRGDAPGSLRDLAALFAMPAHASAWLELEHSVLTGEGAFGHVHGGKPWEHGRQHPSWNDAFNAAMSSIAGAVHEQIARFYDFSGLHLLVDVGGGHGRLMGRILERFPTLKGIVFDQPHVVDAVPSYMAERGLADRCRAVAGDFFASVPGGADAYIMTTILHDWDDDACVRILRNCRDAMAPTGRVLIGDFILKPANQPDLGRLVDLEMLVIAGIGRERTEPEFRSVLARAGFALNRVVPLPAATSLIEAIPDHRRSA